MRVVIWNENCVLAGRAVSDSEIEGYDDPRDCGDWTVREGTPEELLETAATLPTLRGRAYDSYYERVARVIREAVYLERPDLNTEIECAYCGAEVTNGIVPALDDDAAWAAMSSQHNDDCEWITTRAHRLTLDS